MPASTARILVLDDNEPFRRTVAHMLATAGFAVAEAGSMSEVLAALDGAEPVDLLLADLRLAPGSPHGFSIGRMVQMQQPQIKLIFMTGGDPLGFALADPTDIVLHKPFRARQLIATIEAALGWDDQ